MSTEKVWGITREPWVRDLAVAVLTTIVFTVILVLVDAFDFLHAFSREHENWDLDEMILGVGVLALSSVWFAWRRQREAQRHLRDRADLERGLRKNNDELAFIISAAPGVLYTCEPEGEFAATFVSPSVKAQLGYEPSDFTDTAVSWVGNIHPEDQQNVFAGFGSLYERGHHTREYRFRHADGSYHWMLDQLKLLRDSKGEPERIVGFCYDITDQKEFEQRLTVAVDERTAELSEANDALQKEIKERKKIEEERGRTEATNLMLARIVEDSINEIYVFDADTLKFMRVNSAACKNLGYTSEELAELTPIDFKPEITLENLGRTLSPLRNGEARYLRFKSTLHRKDASQYDVEVIMQLVHSADRPVFVAIVEDITDRKQAEEQLHQAQKMEAVGQLTGGIAHDFNNMLAAVIGNLEILTDHLDGNASAKQSLDAAFRASTRAADLTHRLLAFSRQQSLESEAMDLREALAGMRGLLQTTLTASVELEMQISEDLRPIWADSAQLESAILNLAINARDAMPKGGRLLIEATNIDLDEDFAAQNFDIEPGSYVVLSVSDSGFGIPDDVRARVFEPFFTTKEVGKGSGLGLSMIFGFVKQLGGNVTLYSEEGHGTCVKLYLPVAKTSTTASPGKSASQGTYPGGAETILVVEDDADVREATLALLQKLGYRILSAENGPAALTLLEEHRDVDLLFTDMVMPGGMNGADLAREVSDRIPKLKVLCTSGYSDNTLAEVARTELGIEWIGKPFLLKTLAQKVRQVLDGPEA